MLITPEFSLSQTETHLKIAVKAPFAKISETEINAQGKEFYFYSRPYHLRLNLPGAVVDTEQVEKEEDQSSCKVKYDVDRQTFEISLEKAEKGKSFEGLGLITNLLVASSSAKDNEVVTGGERRQLIEEIDSSCTEQQPESIIAIPPHYDWALEQPLNDYGSEKFADGDDDDEDGVYPPQAKFTTTSSVKLPGGPGSDNYSYGFGNRFKDDDSSQNKGRFAKIQECFPDVVSFRDPVSQLSLKKRFEQKILKEKEDFSQDHYLANLFDREDRKTIEKLLDFDFPENFYQLSDQDRKDLVEKLKNRKYLLSFDETVSAFLGLVDILFAYCYDLRINEGEHCVESDWNISKISATLSWFVQFKSLKSVQVSCFRRAIVYPLYRSFELANKCWSDTIKLLKAGPEAVLHALLDVRRIFQQCDSASSPKYILNELYLNDYCVWVQKTKRDQLKSLAEAARELGVLPKNESGFDLEMIEHQGLQVLEGGDDNEDDLDLIKGASLSSSLGRHSDSEDCPTVLMMSKMAFSSTKTSAAS